jgi:hypothetical protein
MVTAFCAQGVCIGYSKTVTTPAQLYDAGFITIKRWHVQVLLLLMRKTMDTCDL